MPNPCYAIYLTCDPAILKDIDKYIEYAKTTKINAFVVNIMDGTSIGYNSPVYEEYSPTAYQYANNTVEEYQAVIQKIKDAGFYAIGRLTTFNDSFFCQDHPVCRGQLLAQLLLPLRMGIQGRAGHRRGADHGLRRDPVRLCPFPGQHRPI